MSYRRSLVLRLVFVFTALGACSGDDTDRTAFPDEDASALDDTPPTFDVPSTDTPRVDASTDRGTNVTDRGFVDRGASETTVCPASCTASTDCDPCRTADTPSTVAYCCISGLCVSMTGTCPAPTGDGGIGGDANDGSPGDSFDPSDTPDPTDDTPPDPTDDAGPPPDDVVSDLGGDAATSDAATGDVTVDAGVAMDAAHGAD